MAQIKLYAKSDPTKTTMVEQSTWDDFKDTSYRLWSATAPTTPTPTTPTPTPTQPVQAAGIAGAGTQPAGQAATSGLQNFAGQTPQQIADQGYQISGTDIYSNGVKIGTTTAPTTPTTQQPAGLTQPPAKEKKEAEGDLDSGDALLKKVEETNKDLTANKDFVNAAFKAYHNRDANEQELTKFAGLSVGDVIKQIKGGAPTLGFNAQLQPAGQAQQPAGLTGQPTGEVGQQPAGLATDKQFYRIGQDIFEAGTDRKIGSTEWGESWSGQATEIQAPQKAGGLISETYDTATEEADKAPAGLINDVADTRQQLLDKIDELAGIKSTALSEQQTALGLTGIRENLTDINQQIADIRVAWRAREQEIRGKPILKGAADRLIKNERTKVNAELADLSIQKAVQQADWDMASQLAKDNADDIYDAKELELKKLEIELGFLEEDEKVKLDAAKEKISFRRDMALEGFVYISDVEALKKLGADEIIKVPTESGVDDIYKIPQKMSEMEVYEAKKKIDAKYKTGTGRSGGASPGQAGKLKPENAMLEQLSTVVGEDGYISPDDYLTARNAWIAEGLSPTTFDTKFRGFRNPNNPYYITEKTKTTTIKEDDFDNL